MTIKRPVGRPSIYVSAQLIRHLKSQGLSFRQISTITGHSYGTVRRAVNKLEAAGPRSSTAASARG
jgi:transposase